jgi:O-antigen/teichoic acid export membrane protein
MSAERIIKNVGSGLLAQVWSVVLGLVALPILVRGLGADRYGLLALCLTVIGFASVADLGVGRAASKYLAEDFERNQRVRTQRYISSALTISVAMGVLTALVLAAFSPFIVHNIFRVPQTMEREAKVALWIMAGGLLPVLVRILFDGVLAGHHRIALLNAGNTISNTLKAGLSVTVLLLGYSLRAVVLSNVVVSYLYAAALWIYTRHYFGQEIQFRFGWDRGTANQLLSLGIGSSLSYIVGWVLFLYVDRLLIAAFLTLSLVGYYSAAFDIASKQWYVSFSVGQSLFPEFSGKAATNPQSLERRYLQANKMTAVGATGLAMLLVVFGRELLTYWISPEFGARSSAVMSILSFALLLSCYLVIPYTAIIAGAARPNVCTRLFIVAVLIHVGVSILLMRSFGILGVAFAFGLAYLFVFWKALRWVQQNLVATPIPQILRECFAGAWLTAAAVGIGLWFMVKPSVHSLPGVIIASSGGYAAYLATCAVTAYSAEERSVAIQVGRKLLRGTIRNQPVRETL